MWFEVRYSQSIFKKTKGGNATEFTFTYLIFIHSPHFALLEDNVSMQAEKSPHSTYIKT